MIARELTEFFAGFAPDGAPGAPAPRAASRSSPTSTPATGATAGRRSASTTSPTPRTRRSARAMLAARLGEGLPPAARRCCTRTTTRRSASCAATSTSTAGCARPSGHVERIGVRSTARDVRGARRAPTGAGCASRAGAGAQRARWTAARRVHHARPQGLLRARLARATGCPRAVAAGDLARGPRDGRPPRRPARPQPEHRAARGPDVSGDVTALARDGAAPLLDAGARDGGRASGCTSPS